MHLPLRIWANLVYTSNEILKIFVFEWFFFKEIYKQWLARGLSNDQAFPAFFSINMHNLLSLSWAKPAWVWAVSTQILVPQVNSDHNNRVFLWQGSSSLNSISLQHLWGISGRRCLWHSLTTNSRGSSAKLPHTSISVNQSWHPDNICSQKIVSSSVISLSIFARMWDIRFW